MSGLISTEVGTKVTKTRLPFPQELGFSRPDWDKLAVGTTLEVTQVDKGGKDGDVIHLLPIPRIEGISEIYVPSAWFITRYFHVVSSGQQNPLFLPPDRNRSTP